MNQSVRLGPFILALAAAAGAQTSPPVTGIIEGVVQNSITGQPIEGARVKLSGMEQELYAKTDSAGHFQFARLGRGNYTVVAQFPGFLEPGQSGNYLRGASPQIQLPPPTGRNAGVMVTYGGQPEPPDITTDADGTVRASVSVALTPQAVITGKVTDPNGVACANCRMEVLTSRPACGGLAGPTVFSPDGSMQFTQVANTTTDDRGEFRAGRLAAGSYYLRVDKQTAQDGWESSYRETFFPHAIDLASAKPLDVQPGKVVRAEIEIVRLPGVRVAGKVIEPPGQPAPSHPPRTYTSLSLEPPAGFMAVIEFTNTRDGNFEIKDVLPGKHTLLAVTREAGNSPQKELSAARKDIEVPESGLDGITVEMEPLRELSGIVTFVQGCPLEAVGVQAYGFGTTVLQPSEAVSGVPDGRFVLSGLGPMRYHLSVRLNASSGQLFLASAKLGDIDVTQTGFDVPRSGDATLQILVNCRPPVRIMPGRVQ